MSTYDRLAKWILDYQTIALQRWADEHLARKAAQRARKAPRRRVAASERSARRDRMAEIRAIVQARAGNSCELCGVIGTEAHHVISGPSRRVKEAPDTIVLLCGTCHRATHRSEPGTLSMLATLEHLSPEARDAVRRRLAKVR